MHEDPFYTNGHSDSYCNMPARTMRLATERDRKVYFLGYEQGCRDRLSDIHEDFREEIFEHAEARIADRIDGYDRDDLGESPDW